MSLSLNNETQRAIEERLKRGDFHTADDLVQTAIQTLDHLRGEDIEDLDPETQQAIARAEAQSARGEGRPWEDVREELKAKYLSK
jgi:Arc/MetJ-type ribon-helix-helix transcriptional regulator